MIQHATPVEIDGLPVYVDASAAPTRSHGLRIVLVHGAQNDHRAWKKPLAWFANHDLTAIAPDLPGHGKSGGAPLESIPLMGQWLNKLLDQIRPLVGPDMPCSTVLVGHSMGSLAALECAALQSNRIAALVLIGTAFPMRVSSGLLEQTRTGERAAISQIAQWSYAPDAPEASEATRELRRERMATAEQLMMSQARGVLHTDLNACNSYQRGLEAAGTISCPALVIAGSKDQMTAAKFALAIQQTLHAELHTIDGAGHAMMDEQGEAVCEAIVQFLSSHKILPPHPAKQ